LIFDFGSTSELGKRKRQGVFPTPVKKIAAAIFPLALFLRIRRALGFPAWAKAA
jgi:hypothetical protein